MYIHVRTTSSPSHTLSVYDDGFLYSIACHRTPLFITVGIMTTTLLVRGSFDPLSHILSSTPRPRDTLLMLFYDIMSSTLKYYIIILSALYLRSSNILAQLIQSIGANWNIILELLEIVVEIYFFE